MYIFIIHFTISVRLFVKPLNNVLIRALMVNWVFTNMIWTSE